MPAFYTSVPRKMRDLRQEPAASDAAVDAEPASATTNEQPELTDAAVAPEASPAKTRRSKKANK